MSEVYQAITDLLLEVASEDSAAAQDTVVGNSSMHVANIFFTARPRTIAGGTSEVQRNVIAKYVLGLPG